MKVRAYIASEAWCLKRQVGHRKRITADLIAGGGRQIRMTASPSGVIEKVTARRVKCHPRRSGGCVENFLDGRLKLGYFRLRFSHPPGNIRMPSRLACYAFLFVTAAIPESARAENSHAADRTAADAAPGARTAVSSLDYRMRRADIAFVAASEPPSLVLLASGFLGLLVLTSCIRRKRPAPPQPWWLRRGVYQSSMCSSFNPK
jgi:hypothetical protein